MRIAALTLALSLAACARPVVAPSTASVDATPGAPLAEVAALPEPAVSTPSTPAPPPRLLLSAAEDLRIPSERSCLLTAPSLGYAVLRLTPEGVDFAQVSKVTAARVHVTADPVGTGLFVEVDKGPVALSGITPAAQMAIYPKRSITLGGFFLPAGDTDLRIAGASKDRVLLEAARTPYALRDLTTMLSADVPCDAASLVAARIDARGPLGRAVGVRYLASARVPLSLTADGEPVATLAAEGALAEILQRTPSAARIVTRVDGGYVSGWVPARQLGARGGQGEGGRGFGIGTGRGRRASRDRRVCQRDVALGVIVGQELRFVGRIRARAVIEVWGWAGGGGWSAVDIPGADIQLLNGASLFVRNADIQDCAEAPPKLQY